MTNRIRKEKRTFVLTAIIGSILIVLMVLANTIWSSKQTIVATDDAVSAVSSFYLEAMADRRAKTITNLIQSGFDQMAKAVNFVEKEHVNSQEELRAAIGKVKTMMSIDRFGLVDESNMVYTEYSTYTGGSRHEFLSGKTMEGPIISTTTVYGSDIQLVLAIPTPNLRILGKSFKACFIQFDISDVVRLLSVEDESRTYFGLYTRTGKNISGTELGQYIGTANLFEALEGNLSGDALNSFRSDFTGGGTGNVTFSAEESETTLFYVPIEGTEWDTVVLIKESVIQDQIRDISDKNLATGRRQIFVALAAVLILGVILFIQFRKLSKDRLEEEKANSRNYLTMANTDSMTGLRNKHAFAEYETSINQQLQEGSLDKLAVVVCDLNGLKYVNDNIGHAAGDKLIKDAAALLTGHFTHGAVFRIGGDEFAVVLQGKGYDTLEPVAAEFNRTVEENVAKDEVVVSIGYSVFGEGDRTLHDVFERADKLMYERKQQLKAMGAHTRD